jgi:hypothetical protein
VTPQQITNELRADVNALTAEYLKARADGDDDAEQIYRRLENAWRRLRFARTAAHYRRGAPIDAPRGITRARYPRITTAHPRREATE